MKGIFRSTDTKPLGYILRYKIWANNLQRKGNSGRMMAIWTAEIPVSHLLLTIVQELKESNVDTKQTWY